MPQPSHLGRFLRTSCVAGVLWCSSTRNIRRLFGRIRATAALAYSPCPAKLQSKHSSPPPLDPRQHYFFSCRRQGTEHPTGPLSTRVGREGRVMCKRRISGRKSGSGSITTLSSFRFAVDATTNTAQFTRPRFISTRVAAGFKWHLGGRPIE